MEQPPKPRCSWKRVAQDEKARIDKAGRSFAALAPLAECLLCDGDKADCKFFIDIDELRGGLHTSDDSRKI